MNFGSLFIKMKQWNRQSSPLASVVFVCASSYQAVLFYRVTQEKEIRTMIRTGNRNNLDRWRPWRASDMESLMYPHIIFSQCFGLFPFERNSEGYVFSKLRFACSTIMLLAHLSFVAYVLFVSRTTMTNLILSLSESWKTHVFIHILCDGILILITYVFTHDRLVILQRISKLSRVISRREFDDMAKFIHTKDIVVMLYYGLQLLCFAAMSELHSLRQFFIIYVSCATIQGAMFYINCVYFLGGCFKKVDDILRHLNEPLPPHRLELLRTFQSLLNEQDASMIIKLKRCEKLHEEISDVVELLNKSYRVPLNIITVFTFYTITFNLYFFIQSFESDEEGYLVNGLYHLLTLLYVVYELTKYSVIIWVCETATNHANQVATTIDNVHANCTDSTARHELKCFTLQVAHRDVQFSANTFVMNAKLLSQLLGQIVIYVMILFQFLFGINCDGKRSS